MRIKATKMDGCGNSFLVVDEMKTPLAGFDRSLISSALAAQHETDGILFVDVNRLRKMPSMKIFDCDGTEETMCGNGLRCATRYFRDTYVANDKFSIDTGDGQKAVGVIDDLTEVDLGEARDYRQISDQLHYVFTGVPHLVVIGSEISTENARIFGRSLREDRSLCEFVGHPEGINVNFIWRDQEGIVVRTYEVGVENVTLSCGTGSAASAFVATKVFGTALPIVTNSLGGSLRITENNGHLSIRGQTRYQGKVIGFVNGVYPKPIIPIDYRHHQHYW
ncbi:diaminopimelate epimerase [Nitrosomonas sp.]|uniref:diaminopimelate epimerase n=1 Tax=Nitrosomonas sp. TaxID=42353 RepID=UPI0025CBF852|nr:diaminopimelate epimerase [Nitrosomonas sp.]MBY0484530.1 diaminopimelate epimerase [Nitrosomonas sp.]